MQARAAAGRCQRSTCHRSRGCTKIWQRERGKIYTPTAWFIVAHATALETKRNYALNRGAAKRSQQITPVIYSQLYALRFESDLTHYLFKIGLFVGTTASQSGDMKSVNTDIVCNNIVCNEHIPFTNCPSQHDVKYFCTDIQKDLKMK